MELSIPDTMTQIKYQGKSHILLGSSATLAPLIFNKLCCARLSAGNGYLKVNIQIGRVRYLHGASHKAALTPRHAGPYLPDPINPTSSKAGRAYLFI